MRENVEQKTSEYGKCSRIGNKIWQKFRQIIEFGQAEFTPVIQKVQGFP